MSELKQCPFCGGEPLIQEHEAHSHSDALKRLIPGIPDHPGSWTIECCDVGMIKDTRAEVIAAWNRRAPSPSSTDGGEREAFEAWWQEDGKYHSKPKENCFRAWQAARARPALTDEQIIEVAARVASNSLNMTRVHELHGKTTNIMEDDGVVEFARAIERALNGGKE